MRVNKSQIVAILRARELDSRAEWADRTLPEIVDTVANAALLKTLAIDESSLEPTTDARPGSGGNS